MSTQILEVGDRVEWSSQAGGYYKKKEGKVILIVPGGVPPHRVMFENIVTAKFVTSAIDSRTCVRKEVSYVVEVAAKGSGRPHLYWPVVSNLKKIDDAQKT